MVDVVTPEIYLKAKQGWHGRKRMLVLLEPAKSGQLTKAISLGFRDYK